MNEQKVGFFTVIGETNVGKSTLINTILGKKVSIVTHKVQTTRNKILGVTTIGNNQLILIDTPGLFNSKDELGSEMLKDTWNEIYNADNILLIIDISKKNTSKSEKILNKLSNKNIILVFNKIDKVKKDILPLLAKKFYDNFGIENIFMISAIKKDGTSDLKNYLLSLCKEEDWAFEKNHVTDMPMSVFFAEITREKIYEFIHQEIPYTCNIETTKIDKSNIYQTIYVSKDTHKPILIGKDGKKIKTIGTAARLEISKIFHKKFNLFLNVELMVKQ